MEEMHEEVVNVEVHVEVVNVEVHVEVVNVEVVNVEALHVGK